MLLSLCGGWGLISHFRVQPNHCVEVVLRCVVVGVVTIVRIFSSTIKIFTSKVVSIQDDSKLSSSKIQLSEQKADELFIHKA